MWWFEATFGIKPGAGAWSLTSALPHVQQNGQLTHPQDLDGPIRVAAQRKINAYRQQYADNQNISFLPAVMSTSVQARRVFANPQCFIGLIPNALSA